jgi:hypothetical protein
MDLQDIFGISFILVMMGSATRNYWEDIPGIILMIVGGCGMLFSGGVISLKAAGFM